MRTWIGIVWRDSTILSIAIDRTNDCSTRSSSAPVDILCFLPKETQKSAILLYCFRQTVIRQGLLLGTHYHDERWSFWSRIIGYVTLKEFAFMIKTYTYRIKASIDDQNINLQDQSIHKIVSFHFEKSFTGNDTSSVFVLAKASVRSNRKLFFCIMWKRIYRAKVSQKHLI